MRTGHRLADIGPLQIHNPAPAPPTFRSTCFHSSPQARSHSFQAPQPVPSLPGPIDPPPVDGPHTSPSDPKGNLRLPLGLRAPRTATVHARNPFRHVTPSKRTIALSARPLTVAIFPFRRSTASATSQRTRRQTHIPPPAVFPIRLSCPHTHDPSQPSRVAMSAGPCLARI